MDSLSRRLQAWEPLLHAFADLNRPEPSTLDALPDAAGAPLSGLSFAVKDIIDVRGVPTRNCSRVFQDAGPARSDAPVVRSLRRAGARYAGKATTTEFAFIDPTDCRNPHDLDRSPGGSSSGSGAAVAARVVDIALGTQTAGSLCRPAAYCGVVGFKPSYGMLPTEGVTPLAPSFDTVGVIATSVALARQAFLAMAPRSTRHAGGASDSVTAVSGLFQSSATPTDHVLEALRAATAAASELGTVSAADRLPADAAAVVADHRTVMLFEAARAHGHLLGTGRAGLLRPKFGAALHAGAGIPDSAASDATGRLAEARDAFWADLLAVDVVITPPVPDGAPLMDGTTGFQDWLTPWTVFGGPLVCLPWGLDPLGRPLSVMLAARPSLDLMLLDVAARLERLAPPAPVPVLPAC